MCTGLFFKNACAVEKAKVCITTEYLTLSTQLNFETAPPEKSKLSPRVETSIKSHVGIAALGRYSAVYRSTLSIAIIDGCPRVYRPRLRGDLSADRYIGEILHYIHIHILSCVN